MGRGAKENLTKSLVKRDLERAGSRKQNGETYPQFYRELSSWDGIWGVLTALQRMLQASIRSTETSGISTVTVLGTPSVCLWLR